MVYFLTLMFGVCLFYMFNSMETQQAMLAISNLQMQMMKTLTVMMEGLSVFVAIILGFLILYANNFLIRRRKKELGIYMILGMAKQKVSMILIVETAAIGLIALAVGLLIGIFASQGLSVLTAQLMEVNLSSFQFTFSFHAALKSVIYFGVIFLIVMMFNTVSVSRYQLVDLLTAAKKNETLHVKKLWVSVVIFLIAVGCLVTAYLLIIDNGLYEIDNEFWSAIFLAIAGTLLFFFSLSGFLLRVIKTNRRIYYHNLNMFVLRQLNSKIATTFVSMSVICLMLLLTIGTLSCGFGMSAALTQSLKEATPYDASIIIDSTRNPNDQEAVLFTGNMDIDEWCQQQGMDFQQFEEDHAIYSIYVDDTVIYDKLIADKTVFKGNERQRQAQVPIMRLSDFNQLLQLQGKEPVELAQDEYLLTCNFDLLVPAFEKTVKDHTILTLNGIRYRPVSQELFKVQLNTSTNLSNAGTIVLSDTAVDGLHLQQQVLNINYPEEKKQISEEAFQKEILELDSSSGAVSVVTKIIAYEANTGLKVILSYLGLYLGVVFLITSAASLALQQLSEASDNIERYRLLRKIGTENAMINRSLFIQILIYFMMPMSLAIIHSIVGLTVANHIILQIGQLDIWINTLSTAVLILLIYGAYCLATYLGSRNMIREHR